MMNELMPIDRRRELRAILDGDMEFCQNEHNIEKIDHHDDFRIELRCADRVLDTMVFPANTSHDYSQEISAFVARTMADHRAQVQRQVIEELVSALEGDRRFEEVDVWVRTTNKDTGEIKDRAVVGSDQDGPWAYTEHEIAGAVLPDVLAAAVNMQELTIKFVNQSRG